MKVLLALSDSMWLVIVKCTSIVAVLVRNPSFVCSRRLIVWSINLTLGYWCRGLVQLIEEEDYWKRRASERWRNCDIACHGDSWKQLFFERNLNEFLEEYANSFLYLAMRCPHYRVLSCINLNYLRPACTNTTCHCWSFNCFDQKIRLMLRLGKLFQFTHNDGFATNIWMKLCLISVMFWQSIGKKTSDIYWTWAYHSFVTLMFASCRHACSCSP